MSPYSNPPKKISLYNFDDISSANPGSIIITREDTSGLTECINNNDITFPEDANNFNILNDTQRSINIGKKTTYQSNNTNICIGPLTGDGIGNSSNCVAIGAENQNLTMSGDNNISIGLAASRRGNTNCSNSISLGYQSGFSFKNSHNVSIGTSSSYNAGGKNTIVISDQTGFTNTLENALYIKPIRSLAVAGMPTNALSYNPTTGEWTYNP